MLIVLQSYDSQNAFDPRVTIFPVQRRVIQFAFNAFHDNLAHIQFVFFPTFCMVEMWLKINYLKITKQK